MKKKLTNSVIKLTCLIAMIVTVVFTPAFCQQTPAMIACIDI